MSKINIKATIIANSNDSNAGKIPVITRVQVDSEYRFAKDLSEIRSLLESGKYSIFVNHIRGKENKAPFEKGQLCSSYKEAIKYIASNCSSENKYRVDLVLRNRQYSPSELEAIASSLDF